MNLKAVCFKVRYVVHVNGWSIFSEFMFMFVARETAA